MENINQISPFAAFPEQSLFAETQMHNRQLIMQQTLLQPCLSSVNNVDSWYCSDSFFKEHFSSKLVTEYGINQQVFFCMICCILINESQKDHAERHMHIGMDNKNRGFVLWAKFLLTVFEKECYFTYQDWISTLAKECFICEKTIKVNGSFESDTKLNYKLRYHASHYFKDHPELFRVMISFKKDFTLLIKPNVLFAFAHFGLKRWFKDPNEVLEDQLLKFIKKDVHCFICGLCLRSQNILFFKDLGSIMEVFGPYSFMGRKFLTKTGEYQELFTNELRGEVSVCEKCNRIKKLFDDDILIISPRHRFLYRIFEQSQFKDMGLTKKARIYVKTFENSILFTIESGMKFNVQCGQLALPSFHQLPRIKNKSQIWVFKNSNNLYLVLLQIPKTNHSPTSFNNGSCL